MLWTYAVNHSVIDIPYTFYRSGSQATLMSKIILKEIRKYSNQYHFFSEIMPLISLDNLNYQRNLLLTVKINTS